MPNAMKTKESGDKQLSDITKKLEDPKVQFETFKKLLLNDPETLRKVINITKGREAIVGMVIQTEEATKMFAEVFSTEIGRKNTARFLGTDEGIKIVGDSVKSVQGGQTVGNLFGMKNGAKVMSLTLAYHPINTLELAYVDVKNSIYYQKLAPPMPGSPEEKPAKFKATQFGKEFQAYFKSEDSSNALVKKLRDKEFRSQTVDFLKTTEARMYLKDVLKDKDARHLLARVMKSSAGRKTMASLADSKEGLETVSGVLWNTQQGRDFVGEEMLDGPRGLLLTFSILWHEWRGVENRGQSTITAPSSDAEGIIEEE